MTITQQKQLDKFLASDDYKAALKSKQPLRAGATSKSVNQGVVNLCAKWSVLEPKARAIAALVTIFFPKSKSDFSTLVDGLNAFCSVQK